MTQFIGQGHNHEVWRITPTQVIKFPTEPGKITLHQAETSVRFFSEKFREFVPTTQVESDGIDSYIIRQDFVDGSKLNGYVSMHGYSPAILEQIKKFAERAWEVYQTTGITFDLLGSKNPQGNKLDWNDCTNIIVSGNTMQFIDTVDATSSIRRGKMANTLAEKLFPGRKKRVDLLERLYRTSQGF